MKRTSLFLCCCLIMVVARTQIPQGSIVVRAIIVDGDTIPLIETKALQIISSRQLLTEEEIRKNAKLIRNVKKVYPYAKAAKTKLTYYSVVLAEVKSEKERKQIMKKAENELEKEFGKDLKKLTFSQGKVLIKLIDRETGNSSYDLVRDLRGSFRAFFYQTFAKIFGYNLKSRFDPKTNSEDELIDRIIRAIDLNQI